MLATRVTRKSAHEVEKGARTHSSQKCVSIGPRPPASPLLPPSVSPHHSSSAILSDPLDHRLPCIKNISWPPNEATCRGQAPRLIQRLCMSRLTAFLTKAPPQS